jgi:hypothetical protein
MLLDSSVIFVIYWMKALHQRCSNDNDTAGYQSIYHQANNFVRLTIGMRNSTQTYLITYYLGDYCLFHVSVITFINGLVCLWVHISTMA